MEKVIRKIYGKDRASDIINAMEENPWSAGSLVLSRLRQKEEEWKISQSEWASIWAETERDNYWKALDVQGTSFKAADKKRFSQNRFVSEIESKRKAQIARINGLGEVEKTFFQFKVELDDKEVFFDMLKLILSFLDHTNSNKKADLEDLLKTAISLVFGIPIDELSSRLAPIPPVEESYSTIGAEATLPSGSATPNNGAKRTPFKKGANPDLRKRAIKNAGGSVRKRGRGGSLASSRSPSVSRAASPALTEGDVTTAETEAPGLTNNTADLHAQMPVESGAPNEGEPAKFEWGSIFKGRRLNFFANSSYFCFFYAFSIMYDRLFQFKTIAQNSQPENYDRFLESCESRFENELSLNDFEDLLKEVIGPQGYLMFHLERNLNFLLKMLEQGLSDPSCLAVLELLRRDRSRQDRASTASQLEYKQDVLRELGGTSDLYRIEWVPGHQSIFFYLYGKDELNVQDLTQQEEAWKSYIADYAVNNPTKGVKWHVSAKYLLRRNLKHGNVGAMFSCATNMEHRISVSTFAMSLVPGTEDSWVVLRQSKKTDEEDLKVARYAKFLQWAERKVQTSLS
ncbi:hypothetical protein BT69DRAFT_1359048 [Atractiella rhizophila]|nr:hypothetical protein BT69DRAFT_1359048 [Atractiella rhizophila]